MNLLRFAVKNAREEFPSQNPHVRELAQSLTIARLAEVIYYAQAEFYRLDCPLWGALRAGQRQELLDVAMELLRDVEPIRCLCGCGAYAVWGDTFASAACRRRTEQEGA